MQHDEARQSLGGAGTDEPSRASWTFADLAFVALMVIAFAIMITGILLGPQTGLVHPEL
jgi:cytochrome b561